MVSLCQKKEDELFRNLIVEITNYADGFQRGKCDSPLPGHGGEGRAEVQILQQRSHILQEHINTKTKAFLFNKNLLKF